jgi:hypothetical protein
VFGPSARACARYAIVLVSLVAAVVVSVSAPGSAKSVHVSHHLFGMHDGTDGTVSLSQLGEGAVRLSAVGVQWRQIERHPGVYDWSRLDEEVSAAQAAHAEVTMVVAMTPRFYASSPFQPPRRIGPYKRFVRALMERYSSFNGARGIAAYQVWTETNIPNFWSGTLPQIARLTRAVAQMRDRYDPEAKVVAPAMVTRRTYELDGLSKYYGFRLDGVPVWKYIDAVALSLYPQQMYGRRAGVPEDTLPLLAQVRRRLQRAGVPSSKGIWVTEINYGVAGGTAPTVVPIPAVRQASNVVRTYLLAAANGVSRVFWFRYDIPRGPTGGLIANTLLSEPGDPSRLTPAGRAYLLAEAWMHGTLVGTKGHRPCPRDKSGTYRCVVAGSSGRRWIYWNPFDTVRVRLPHGVRHLQGVLGRSARVRSSKVGTVVKVGPNPVMASR